MGLTEFLEEFFSDCDYQRIGLFGIIKLLISAILG